MIFKDVLSLLDTIKGSGAFCSNGVCDFVLPGLHIAGIDEEISFPLHKTQIEKLISVAHKAPFGKGSETVLDTSVRNTWEIDASKITFHNSKWDKLINEALQKIKPELGVEDYEISANLYKMLIYGEDDFFTKHRDSEKEPGMFGTLVVGLPSIHEGGEFIVNFENEKRCVSFVESTKDYKIPYIAFYADCEHEVKPITDGYRVCFTYNLVQNKSGKSPKVPQLSSVIKKITKILTKEASDTLTPKAILLGHQYTPTNFSLKTLKLNDRSKAEALIKAAEKAGYYAKLGLVTSYVAGELLLEDYDYYDRRYYNRDNEMSNDGEMGEIYESYIEVRKTKNDDMPSLNNLMLKEEDIIKNFDLNEGDPTEKESEGYTGNAGMEMMYWYHYGAVFVWPKATNFELTTTLPLENQLQWLRYYISRWETIAEIEKKIAHKIATNTPETGFRYYIENIDFNALADYFIMQKHTQDFLPLWENVLVGYFENISIDKWKELLNAYTIRYFNSIFAKVAEKEDITKTEYLIKILRMVQQADNAVWEAFLLFHIKQMPEYLKSLSFDSTSQSKKVKNIINNTLSLSVLADVNTDWVVQITKQFTKKITRSYMNKILVKELLQPKFIGLPLQKSMLRFCRTYLQKKVDDKPSPPKNWTREIPSTKDSKIWGFLSSFMQSPTQQEFLYKRTKEFRSHMEEVIKKSTVDLAMTTIRKGSPHTLKITKTQGAYDRAYKKWKEDSSLLLQIKKIA